MNHFQQQIEAATKEQIDPSTVILYALVSNEKGNKGRIYSFTRDQSEILEKSASFIKYHGSIPHFNTKLPDSIPSRDDPIKRFY